MLKISRLLVAVIAAVAFTLSTGAAASGAAQTGSIAGTVTVPAGANVTNVFVQVEYENFDVAGGASVAADGTYQLDGLPIGSYVVAFLYHGVDQPVVSEYAGNSYKRATASRTSVTTDQTSVVNAGLERGAVLTVTVTDDTGPVPGISLGIVATGDTYESPLVFTLGMLQDGATFVSNALPPGTYRLESQGARWLPSSRDILVGNGGGANVTTVPPGGTSTVAMNVQRRSTIAGAVQVEGAGGQLTPYRGDVTLIDVNDPSSEQLLLIGDGTFEFTGLAAGSYQVRLGGIMTSLDPERSLVPEIYWPGATDPANGEVITVGASDHPLLAPITLRQGGLLSGNVLTNDNAGVPVAVSSIVSLWKLDAATGYYVYHSEKAPNQFGHFEEVVEEGTYAVKARPADETGLGSEWHIDARYFADSTDVVVGQGQAVQFTDMVLEPRYFDVWRLAGENRFGTAVEITRAIYGDPLAVAPPSVIYLTNAFNYPDALAAGPAAILGGGAILPVAQSGAPEVILDEIERLNPGRIVVMGQQNAVSDAVIDQVRARVGSSVPITRNGGASRYETAEMLVGEVFADGSQYAFIVTGQNYPDALSAGAAAGRLGAPVILVPGGGADLPASTAALLTTLGVTDVFIAGGPTTVSPGIEGDLRDLIGSDRVERFAGGNRYQTAAMINAAVFAGSEHALLASGVGFADALAGGPLAGVLGAPLYLTPQNCVPDETYFQIWDQDVQGVTLLGGLPTLGLGVEEGAPC